MKNLYLTSITLLVILFSGCKKAPIDNQIQGFWILKEFTTLKDGQIHSCERLYYSIGRSITEISERQGPNGYGHYVGLTEFRENNTVLVVKDFKPKNTAQGDTGEKVSVESLRPFGLNSQEETVFEILHCNGKTMTLESDYAQLKLEKF